VFRRGFPPSFVAFIFLAVTRARLTLLEFYGFSLVSLSIDWLSLQHEQKIFSFPGFYSKKQDHFFFFDLVCFDLS